MQYEKADQWFFHIVRRLALGLVVFLSIAIWVFYSVESGNGETSPYTVIFSNGASCEAPCLLGIRPGETSYRATLDILRKHPLLFGAREFPDDKVRWPNTMFATNDLHVLIVSGYDQPVTAVQVEWMDIPRSGSGPEQRLLLGNVITRLGIPQWVTLNQSACVGLNSLYYDYNGGSLKVATDDHVALDPDTAVHYVLASRYPSVSVGTKLSWKGFSQVRRYGLADTCS